MLGQLLQRRQMEVGKQRECRPEITNLAWLWFFHLDDDVGLAPDVAGRLDEDSSGTGVFVVGDRAAFTRPGLHQNLVAGLTQGPHTARHERGAGFPVLDFRRYADDHGNTSHLLDSGGGEWVSWKGVKRPELEKKPGFRQDHACSAADRQQTEASLYF